MRLTAHRRGVDAPLFSGSWRHFPCGVVTKLGGGKDELPFVARRSRRPLATRHHPWGLVCHIPGSTLVGLSACPKKAWRLPLSRVEEGPWAVLVRGHSVG